VNSIRYDRWNDSRLLFVQPMSVQPWWAPDTTVKVCPGVVRSGVCGLKLERCLPNAGYQTTHAQMPEGVLRFHTHLDYAFTLEPGAFLAKIILDDHDWNEAVTGTNGTLTGALAHYYQTWGVSMLRNSPPDTFANYMLQGRIIWEYQAPGTPGAAYYTPIWWKYEQGRTLQFPFADPLDRTWHWVERGDKHAGVFSTVAFQKSFNGRRAKAKAAMEAFLCRKFEVPAGITPIVSAEPDLKRHPYCGICHSTLDPLADFFARWPTTGDNNYFYHDPAYSQPGYTTWGNWINRPDPTGSFEGHSGHDTGALGEAFVQSATYGSCGAERVFEFMMRREMSPRERQNLLPELTKTYETTGRRLFPVIEQIATSPLYKGEAR